MTLSHYRVACLSKSVLAKGEDVLVQGQSLMTPTKHLELLDADTLVCSVESAQGRGASHAP